MQTRELRQVVEHQASLVHREKLVPYRGLAQRWLALGLFGVSLFGSLLWGGGGVEAWLSVQPNMLGVIAAMVIQAVATIIQWLFGGRDWYNPLYLGAVAFSTGTSLLGYAPIAHPWLTTWIISWAGMSMVGHFAPYLAGTALALGLLAADVLPERVLVASS